MKDLLSYILSAIVDDSSAIAIDEQVDGDNYTYIVHISQSDMGKVIGKGGKTIRAIRSLMGLRAQKENKRVYVELAESPVSSDTKK